jgi:Domain of unknown function (DUF5615)
MCSLSCGQVQAGQAIPDADVLAFAVAEQRIVVTLNRRHFIRVVP